ncbi:MAG: methionyl-tRNA formyltransferase [Gammaproteobacteria bacterium]|nr:methionyl-tRNA formyltransferase [Gammaproteobacteria bacterium]
MRVAFAGTPEFALPALAALATRHEIVGVLTQPDRRRGRGQKLAPSPVKTAASAARLPLLQPETLRDEAARAQLAAWRPDVMVVVAYGLLLPPNVLTLPRLGCLNIHASLLPRWRGAAPIQRALLAGDAETGISIMQMEAGLDTGPLLLQRRLPIRRDHTGGSLEKDLAALGAESLIAALDGIASEALSPTPQPAGGVTYARKIDKAEARIDWSGDAAGIERQVRAFDPWPVAETRLAGEQLRVLGAHALAEHGPDAEFDTNTRVNVAKSVDPGTILKVSDKGLIVCCGAGLLALSRLQRPGRRAVTAREYAQGLDLVGRRLG